MPRLAKFILNKDVIFVTTSVEEGFPFPPNPLINSILESCLARAQELHPVKICHYLFESNHGHILLVVDNPNDVPGFLDRFKTESAHAVNHLLGRKKRTIWCEGYDSPALLTTQDVIGKIVYLYSNPAKDNLEEAVAKFPGISSWKTFRSGKHKKVCPWINRSAIFPLPDTSLTLAQFSGLARKYRGKCKNKFPLTLSPDAWMDCFEITNAKDRAELNHQIVTSLEEIEQLYQKEHQKAGMRAFGSNKLQLQPMDTPYTPNRTGKKMWCISSNRELRKKRIAHIKEAVRQGREVLERWCRGDFSVPYPLGLFPPSMPKLAEPIAFSVC